MKFMALLMLFEVELMRCISVTTHSIALYRAPVATVLVYNLCVYLGKMILLDNITHHHPFTHPTLNSVHCRVKGLSWVNQLLW